jgi:hypothetical protein
MMARFAMVRALSHGKEAQQERRRKTAKKYQVVSHPNHKRNCRFVGEAPPEACQDLQDHQLKRRTRRASSRSSLVGQEMRGLVERSIQ